MCVSRAVVGVGYRVFFRGGREGVAVMEALCPLAQNELRYFLFDNLS